MSELFLRVGERFLDRYEITEVLGAGGMSRVYGAVQDGLDRRVAIKLLSPAGAENLSEGQFEKIAARFEREAKLISKFRSPNTVVVYDYGMTKDHLYMILEYVDGENLHELVESRGPLPAPRVARILRQALASLAEAHQMGILHRDIKPQNIMVFEHLGDPDNTKVLDFGIAKAIGETGKDTRKLTEERTIVGTPSYMSPEQILGNQLTPASDIYSLGLVAYELLFGIVAVEADSAVSTMARHLAPTPIEIPSDGVTHEDFLNVLRRMVAKDVDKRYPTAADVFRDLEVWDGVTGGATLPRLTNPGAGAPTLDGAPGRANHTTEANNTPLVATGAFLTIAILVAVGVVVMMVKMMGAREEPEASAATPPIVEVAPTEAPSLEEEEAARPEVLAEEVVRTELSQASAVAEAAALAAEQVAVPKVEQTAPKTDRQVDRKRPASPDVVEEPETTPADEPAESKEPVEPVEPKPSPDDFVDVKPLPVTTPTKIETASATKTAAEKKKEEAKKAEAKKSAEKPNDPEPEKKKKTAVPLSF